MDWVKRSDIYTKTAKLWKKCVAPRVKKCEIKWRPRNGCNGVNTNYHFDDDRLAFHLCSHFLAVNFDFTTLLTLWFLGDYTFLSQLL